MSTPLENDKEWTEDCLKWRGRILRGVKSHWCFDYDGLPVDETTNEWPCHCFDEVKDARTESETTL